MQHYIYQLSITGCCLLFIIIWEHFALTNKLKYKPSYFINKVADCSNYLWSLVGKFIAYVGSFWVYLHLDQLVCTISSLLKSVLRLLCSFVYITYGFESIARLYKHSNLTLFFGFVFCVVVFSYIPHYFEYETIAATTLISTCVLSLYIIFTSKW